MPSMRMQLLGGFRFETDDGRPIAVSAKKARALLSYLALTQGMPQSRDMLASLFWGNSGDAQARSSLRQALMTLRKCLPPNDADALRSDSEFVTLNEAAVTVDALEFQRLVQDDTIGNLTDAIALYRGDLLQNLTVTAPEFEDWLVSEQRRYCQMALGAMERLGELLELDGQMDRAVEVASALVSHDPLNEEGHRRLISLLADQGKLNDALRQYQICKDVLRKELDVAPANETEALQRKILDRRRYGAKADGTAVAEPVQAPKAVPGETEPSGQPSAARPETAGAFKGPERRRRATDLPQPDAPAAELRHVAVMFADLSNFTALSGQLWAEDMHRLLNRYFDVTDEVITQFGGTIDKHMGDNVMAIFGAPVAHSDDSERAMRAALEIRQRIAALSEEVGHELKVHVGMASGQVIASKTGSRLHRAYTVLGESVNLAARLQDLAGPSEIIVSDSFYQSVVHAVEGELMDGLLIHGIPSETRAWRLVQLRQERDESQETSFVGREVELEQFAGIARSCVQSGKGRVVYLRGEAGIGKSRLSNELQRIARREGYDCHMGRLQDFGSERGRGALKNLALSLLDLPWGAEARAVDAAFEDAVVKGWLPQDARAFLYDFLDMQQPAELESLHTTIENASRLSSKIQLLSSLIERRCLEQPVMILVDDIHWADDRTLTILAGVAAQLRDAPVILLMTSRVIEDPLDRSWRASAQGVPLTTLDLMPLSSDECAVLSRQYLDVDDAYARACIARSEGNPLFLDQLLRAYGHETRELPGSIQSIVLARLDVLSAREKHALNVASVLGQRFGLADLREVLGDAEYNCANLTEIAILRPEGDNEFAFCHALIHEAIYGAILKSERDKMHIEASKLFEGKNAILYADHLDRAESPEAAAAILQAARHSAAKYHFGTALELASRGLERSRDRVLSYDLSLLSGFLLRVPGSVSKSVEVYERALSYAESDAEKCRAWTGMAEGLRLISKFDQALDVLAKAEEAALNCADDRSLARIYSLTGAVYFPLGRLDECLEAHEGAILAAQRSGSVLDEARALSGLGDAYYQRGWFKTAYGYFDKCIGLCERENVRELLCTNLPMRAIIAFYLLDLERTEEDALRAIEIALQVNNYRAEMLAHLVIGPTMLYMGNPAGSYEHVERAYLLAQQLGSSVFEGESLMHKMQSLARLGHGESIEERLLEAYRVASSARTYGAAWILSALAVETKDVALRKWALIEGEVLLQERCVSHNYLHFYQHAIDAALDGGDWDEADRYANALEAYSKGTEPTPWSAFYVARGRALADFGRGLRDGAELESLRELSEDAERVGLMSAIPRLQQALAEANALSGATL
ncbi:BTAD domain-containing putative transcriptional regulator [Denitrobaculum tricleocarpae]|uniref:AAA family ATPase n=1 Tax=Denitrobaculum tricleocarpae TaxID=2591009 RepID=A0A545T3Y6_9PROT|nr:adenylate/guanylate cyclase domain-containing protein [Denitrobaculum tricleocarpae]TQV71941.1 AAA family ATPase [Denitrobaculum tricleocarpae]